MFESTAISSVSGGGAPLQNRLTPAQIELVAKLAARDREVRTHEAAHMAAAGALAVGGPQYSYEMGPDGKAYAVGGEVKISFSPGQTPEDTLARAEQMRAAANAPSEPSGQDLSVASRAATMEDQARQQILQQHQKGPAIANAVHLQALGTA